MNSGHMFINGKTQYEMTLEEIQEFTADLFDRLRSDLQNGTCSLDNLIEAVQEYDESWNSESCEQCGDTVVTTVWKI
jgi:hypothetical protein